MFRLIMPHKRTRASAQVEDSQNKFYCEEAKARYDSIFKNQQMLLEKGFTLKESNYIDFMAHIQQIAEALNSRDFVLQQQVDVSEDPKEEDPTEIKPMQSTEIPDKAEPMEPITKLDMATSTFRTQSSRPDLRDELSKLMDIMQHMQFQQQAYWRYSKNMG
ncbi:hypothetical protein PVK06_020265 [Gossypium arboreum]|uniref:Uncharacterized protein n=1 Tax=Gossypium arboreum TaxID=29729 RepID=A0ABR0PMB7_GOSAR|nr:hypothetical protein PVK06_020265 [Gossypium arboreum]